MTASASATRLTDNDVARIRALRAEGNKLDWIAREFGVTAPYVHMICVGKRRSKARAT
jgi:hypothetical protein